MHTNTDIGFGLVCFHWNWDMTMTGTILVTIRADLEKAASGASGACGHFVRTHAILRTFLVKNLALLSKKS